MHLLSQGQVVMVSVNVIKGNSGVRSTLEAFESNHLLVNGFDELVITISLHDGTEVPKRGLHNSSLLCHESSGQHFNSL